MVIKGKVAVITGAGSGIGKATAKKLLQEGCQAALLGRTLEKLQKVKSELKDIGPRIETYKCNVSQSDQVKEAFSSIFKDFGRIDFLINSAGFNSRKTLDNLTEAEFDQEMDVNVKGTYLCITQTYPKMKEGGAIVNLSSIRGRLGSAFSSPGYAASKAADANLTKTFALQLAKYKIRVNAVAPGLVYPTELTEDLEKEKLERAKEATPLKRLGTPEDIANAVYFLLSDLSSFITGHTLDVNGGEWMN